MRRQGPRAASVLRAAAAESSRAAAPAGLPAFSLEVPVAAAAAAAAVAVAAAAAKDTFCQAQNWYVSVPAVRMFVGREKNFHF